ncbi:MAG: hypothetical protein ACI837_000822 [Crocinitomicaceae bacterium]|jgi:hypothetical protein
MNKLLTISAILVGFSTLAQKFEIPTKNHPFTDVIEWKGMGSILMSNDPNTRQINLTLVGNQETSIWDQKFTPKNDDYYYLSSENARYVYFIDDLGLKDGKAYFSQLNSAGNVKATSVSIGSALKKLGNYDYNKLELINAVVTDKALVYHFRYDDSKEKSVREFAVFITHHNFLPYAVELGSIKNADLKNDDIGQFSYIGFTDDQIYFAARTYQSGKGWNVQSFTSKGKPQPSLFIKAPKDLLAVEDIGFGTTGKYYLKDKSDIERGLIAQINGSFYMVGGQKRSTGSALVLMKYVDEEWEEINVMVLNYFIEKKSLKLGIYPMNEGIGYHLDHNGYNKVSIISFTPEEESAHNDFTDRAIYNPSCVLHRKKKEEFTVDLPEGVLVFDASKLGTATVIEFELREK